MMGLAAMAECDGQVANRVHQLMDAGILTGRDRKHFETQERFQPLKVDPVAALRDLIHHVQGDDHGAIELFQLKGQKQVALKVCRVDDIDDDVRTILQDIVARDDFLDGVRGEGINAGQIDHREEVRSAADHTDLFLDRDAWPVAGRLPCAGQPVEQGGFAAVGIARQCQMNVHVHSSGMTRMSDASFLRIDKL